MAKTPNEKDFFLFIEETSQIDPKTFDYAKRTDPVSASTWWVDFRADVHFFNVINRNTRGYLADNVREMTFSPKNVDMMKRNGWFGEADHPFQMYEGLKLTRKRVEKILDTNRSHKLADPRIDSEKSNMLISTCSGTEVGRGFANDIIQGLIPAFSCRSCGEMEVINGKPFVIISKLITYDKVQYAGFEGAKQVTPTKARKGIVTEEAEDNAHLNLQIPYSELADDLAKDDEKVYAYMESTDGDVSIAGVTPDDKLLLKQKGLYIYAGINKNSLDMVRDFYRSFGKK